MRTFREGKKNLNERRPTPRHAITSEKTSHRRVLSGTAEKRGKAEKPEWNVNKNYQKFCHKNVKHRKNHETAIFAQYLRSNDRYSFSHS